MLALSLCPPTPVMAKGGQPAGASGHRPSGSDGGGRQRSGRGCGGCGGQQHGAGQLLQHPAARAPAPGARHVPDSPEAVHRVPTLGRLGACPEGRLQSLRQPDRRLLVGRWVGDAGSQVWCLAILYFVTLRCAP